MSGNTSYMSRMLDLLEGVVDESRPVTLSALASKAGIPLSTASRLARLLTERGYLWRDEGGAYSPGPRLARLGLSSVARIRGTYQLQDAARELSALTGESASVALVFGSEIVLVARYESEHALRVVVRAGDVIAPGRSALTTAIIALLSPQRREAMLTLAYGATEAEAMLTQLRPELERVAVDGIARDEETYAVGQRCRATPLLDEAGHAVGGLSVAGPVSRLTYEAAESFTPRLLEIAARLSSGEVGWGQVPEESGRG